MSNTPVTKPPRKAILRGEGQPLHGKAMLKDFTLEEVHLFRVNRHSFTIFVGGDPGVEDRDGSGEEPGVEFRMADRFEMNLNYLTTIDSKRPILVHLSSCGGLWDEGMQMFSAILMCPNPVTVLATKWARSMTSIIPLAADKFVIRPPAKYMFHRGTYGFYGLDQEAQTADHERRTNNEMMLRLYIARLRAQGSYKHKALSGIREMLVSRMAAHIDVWLTGDEAVAAGFVDSVFDGDLKNLRAPKKNDARRQAMLDVLRRPITLITTVG